MDSKSTFGGAIRRGAPALVVFAALAAIAWWGHRTGWRAPSFAALFGPPSAAKEDWCKAHNVPDSRCIACHPEFAGEDPADWCQEHGVKESECAICHPEILAGEKAKDWCKEHGVPESQCPQCHPDLVVTGEVAPSADDRTVVASPPIERSEATPGCLTHRLRVQFASAEAVEKAGVKMARVTQQPLRATATFPGEIEYDETRVVSCPTRVEGVVVALFHQMGEAVKAGEALALVDSAEIGRAKSELLLARADRDVQRATAERLESGVERGVRSPTEVLAAKAAARSAQTRLLAAQQTLANLGIPIDLEQVGNASDDVLAEHLRLAGLPELPPEVAKRIGASQTIHAIRAPIDGVVTERPAIEGAVVESLRTLYVIVDTSRMWLTFRIRAEDSQRIQVGQPVTFLPDGMPDRPATARISWISTEADESTRGLECRADVENPERLLRARMYGRARVLLREETSAIVVPDEAVNWEGCCWVTFVRLAPDIFQTRKVKIGVKERGFTEIVAGVAPGEVVAAKGSYVLRSDILRNRLGAG
jgi:cobalt-zinc-cadmium efflux system membrane fusion protein